jgi:hypothetical protein
MWLSVAHSLYNDDVSVIRDGNRLGNGSTFYSIGDDLAKIKDYYGYKWDQPVNIGLVNLNMGSMEESGGWFTSIDVEYLDDNDKWINVEELRILPELLPGIERFNKAHFVEYVLMFKSVNTKGIRIIGDAGSVEHWMNKPIHFTSVTELSIHEPIK